MDILSAASVWESSCTAANAYYEGHSESYLSNHLTVMLAFCFW